MAGQNASIPIEKKTVAITDDCNFTTQRPKPRPGAYRRGGRGRRPVAAAAVTVAPLSGIRCETFDWASICSDSFSLRLIFNLLFGRWRCFCCNQVATESRTTLEQFQSNSEQSQSNFRAFSEQFWAPELSQSSFRAISE